MTVGPHKSLNTSRGVIKHSDFQDCTEEEFVDEFPDVIHARRIYVRKGDVRIPTNTIILTLDCPKPPTSLRPGYLTVPVRPYVPFPRRCFKCHKFGHGKDRIFNADERTLCVVVASRTMLTSISAQLLPTASIAKATIPPLASSALSSSKSRSY